MAEYINMHSGKPLKLIHFASVDAASRNLRDANVRKQFDAKNLVGRKFDELKSSRFYPIDHRSFKVLFMHDTYFETAVDRVAAETYSPKDRALYAYNVHIDVPKHSNDPEYRISTNPLKMEVEGDRLYRKHLFPQAFERYDIASKLMPRSETLEKKRIFAFRRHLFYTFRNLLGTDYGSEASKKAYSDSVNLFWEKAEHDNKLFRSFGRLIGKVTLKLCEGAVSMRDRGSLTAELYDAFRGFTKEDYYFDHLFFKDVKKAIANSSNPRLFSELTEAVLFELGYEYFNGENYFDALHLFQKMQDINPKTKRGDFYIDICFRKLNGDSSLQ